MPGGNSEGVGILSPQPHQDSPRCLRDSLNLGEEDKDAGVPTPEDDRASDFGTPGRDSKGGGNLSQQPSQYSPHQWWDSSDVGKEDKELDHGSGAKEETKLAPWPHASTLPKKRCGSSFGMLYRALYFSSF